MYMDGLFWIGKVNDGTLPSLRMGGVGNYNVGTVPGPIVAGSFSFTRMADASERSSLQ
jgi:hypothetical protein